MGENGEGWASPPPSGLLPNGLLPGKAASVIRVLDAERWAKAEGRTAELIACIQPNPPSEERRRAVANFVQRLIMECFPCQVFTFGSVPLKTYLPDGDIDLTAFSKNQNLKDTWAHLVRDMLEKEEKNENAEFRVKEVQYIQAEVKIIKCLVENIVVDISFDQLGGLCTLCFLEEVDHLINQNHLFKRSIILIKAWCYYESRILGAHHGLISTYALETLVLYIFHVFNNTFAGPLEVLYRFLEFFSKFDWDNFCVSLWGPVPIKSLPDVTAEPPRKDAGELLLSKLFLDACSSVYAVFPGGQENQGQPFVSKHFNVIDPLRVNNNLGRSVSKGNFFRIRSAFAFGAKRLARLLDCPKEDLYHEINQFFMNTWDRHGSGLRPDAPADDLWRLRLSSSEPAHRAENVRNASSERNDNSSGHDTQVDGMHGSRAVSSQHNNYPSESTSRDGDISTASQNQKSGGNINSRTSDHSRGEMSSSKNVFNDKGQISSKPENMVNKFPGKHLFARTRSSPELTETYVEVPSQSRHGQAPEAGKGQFDSTRLDISRKRNQESEILASHPVRSPTDSSSVMHTPSRQSLDSTADTSNAANSYQDDVGPGSMNEEFSAMGTRGMQREEQDLVNMMASSASHGFNGQFHLPINLASSHLPFPISPSILASVGYAQRNLGGMVPTNIPLIETPWAANMQFPQGLVSSPFTHYLPGGFTSNLEHPSEPGTGNDTYGSAETNPGEEEHDFWHEQERGSSGFDLENGGFELHQADDKQLSTSDDYNYLPRTGGSRLQQRFRETRSAREDSLDNSQYQVKGGSQMLFDDRTASSRSVSVSRASSVRSKTSSESSWDGSMSKVTKSARDKRSRKVASSGPPSVLSGKGKSVSEHSIQADDDATERSPISGSELAGRDVGPQSTASLHVQRHQIHGFEPAQTSGSDSPIPIAPLVLGPGSQQRAMDNSGNVPFAFYPTGPPVPFVTVVPFYNFQANAGTSDASTSHLNGDEELENNDSGKSFDSSEGPDQSGLLNSHSTRRAASVEPAEHKSDILNGDFVSHWQNLQYGRFCQNSRYPAPVIYPSPVVVPPAYLQGRFPFDGPGRPLASNANIVNQLMSYGPRLVPVAPLQSVSNRPASVYPRYADEIPRHRSGTGTYFPNPKISARERHSSGMRRGNYGHDRNDHHGDREGGWNISSKPRGSGRSHNRSQAEKPSSRQDRLENRSDRHWSSYRHDSYPSYHSQNGPIRSSPNQGGSANMTYGMYRLPAMKPAGVTSDGHTMQSVVMLYPFDHNVGYGSSAEQLEFGSFGPMGYSAANEVAHLNEGSLSSGAFEEARFRNASAQRSSPDQPSSPHFPRGV